MSDGSPTWAAPIVGQMKPLEAGRALSQFHLLEWGVGFRKSSGSLVKLTIGS
jgi:hypothetical protein